MATKRVGNHGSTKPLSRSYLYVVRSAQAGRFIVKHDVDAVLRESPRTTRILETRARQLRSRAA